MAVNLTARRIRCWIGADNQDWSQAVAGFLPQFASFSENGQIPITASLTLLDLLSNPESLDPRANPSRWRPGQRVQIAIRNANDTAWISYAPLYLLDIPSVPTLTEGRLELALGCWLTWATSREQDADRSGIELGASTNSAIVATRLLEAADIPLENIDLGVWDYAIAVPLVKEAGESFVAQAAELAWANNGRYLYQDVDGDIVAGQWSMTGTPVAAITVGQGEALFDPSPDVIQPVERLKIVGAGFDGAEVPNPYSVSQTTYVDASSFNANTVGEVALVQTIITSWTEPTVEQPYYEIVREVRLQQPQGLAFVDSSGIGPTTIRQFSVRRYDETSKLLIRESEFEIADVRVVMPGTITIGDTTITTFGTLLTYERVAEYTYNADEVIVETVETAKEPRIKVDGSATSDRAALITSRVVTTKWAEEKPDLWTKRTTEEVVARDGGDRRGNIKPTALVTQKPQVEPDSPPPNAERWEVPYGAKEQHYEAIVDWQYPGGASGRTRTRTITVNPGFSNAQCFDLATKNLQILEGRANAYLLELAVTDALVWVPPLSVVTVDDGSNLWTFRADALTWEYTPDSAKVGCVGILIAREPLPDPEGTPLPTFGTGIIPGQVAPPEPPPWTPPSDTGQWLLGYADQPLLDYAGANLVGYPLLLLEDYL